MEQRIFKYGLPLSPEFSIDLPAGAIVLDVQVQQGQPVLWAIINRDADLKPREFAWNGTGTLDPIKGRYIGTVQLQGGSLVLHLFDRG